MRGSGELISSTPPFPTTARQAASVSFVKSEAWNECGTEIRRRLLLQCLRLTSKSISWGQQPWP